MPKQSGLGDALYIGGNDLSGDIGSLGRIGGGPAALEVTGINKSAHERIGGMRDGSLEYTAFFNPAVDGAHPVLSVLPTSDQILTYCRGTALGGWAANLVGKQVGYDPTRAEDGALTIAVQAQGNGYGLEWGRQLTAGVRTDSAATDGTSVEYATGTNFGMQAYLQVFAFTGTSAEVTIQHSSDDGAADAWTAVPGSQFGTVTTGPQAVRSAEFGMTVERYLRVVTTGTFTELAFAVSVAVNPVEVTF